MQTWKINGQVYTHAQLMELKAQGLDPRKDNIEMKFVTRNNKGELVAKADETKPAVEEPKKEPVESKVTTSSTDVEVPVEAEPETEEQEYERLKAEKAWVNNDKKARYNELKAKFK